jgi:hypothetical protein
MVQFPFVYSRVAEDESHKIKEQTDVRRPVSAFTWKDVSLYIFILVSLVQSFFVLRLNSKLNNIAFSYRKLLH